MQTIPVKGVPIGQGRVYVVAEMAWSHDGSQELAIDIVRRSAAAGADCIGVHITNVAAYMVPHYGSGRGRVSAGKEDLKIFNYLNDINIRDEWWPDIFAAAREAGIAVAVMANDFPSLTLARSLQPDLYVIHAAAFTEEPFVRAVAREGRPVLLRAGGATPVEIERAIGWLKSENNSQFVILWGLQNYPTRIEDTHLLRLRHLRDRFQSLVGLADHIDAEDPLATQLPLLALPLGACLIEKHVTHDRAKKGEDHESALNPDELARFVAALRSAEQALGDECYAELTGSEKSYRLVSRKRVVAARNIPAGKLIDEGDCTCKRSDVGVYPEQLSMLIGKRSVTEILTNEGIELNQVA